jgi:hypothetical protein
VLTSDFKSPLVPKPSVASDLEESLDIFSQFGFENVGGHLKILALLIISLSVEEPSGDTVALWVIDQVSDGVALALSELSGSESWVNSQDLADKKSKSSTDTLDLVKCEGDGSLTLDVGVEDTVNMLEGILSVFDN